MPSFEKYQRQNAFKSGEVRKQDANMIMEATWWSDPNSKRAFLFDYYHDSHITKLAGFDNPEIDGNMIPIDVKYQRETSQTYAKDIVTYRIQLRPSQEINVPYYKEMFIDTYSAAFPVGLYILIPDAKGIYNRWLVVGTANYYDGQFPTFEILPCDYIIQYIHKGQKIQIAGVSRSQNS